MQEVFVIIACQGEWSDRTEWPVRVVRSEARARELTSELSAAARQRAIDQCRENDWEDGYTPTEEEVEESAQNGYDYPIYTFHRVPVDV